MGYQERGGAGDSCGDSPAGRVGRSHLMTGDNQSGADHKVYPQTATAVQVQGTEKVKNKSTRDYGKP